MFPFLMTWLSGMACQFNLNKSGKFYNIVRIRLTWADMRLTIIEPDWPAQITKMIFLL